MTGSVTQIPDPCKTTDRILNALQLASDALEPSRGEEPASRLAARQAAHTAVNEAISLHVAWTTLGVRVRKAMDDNVGDDELFNAIHELLERLPAPRP